MNAPLRNALVMLPQPAAEQQPLLPGAVELLRITKEEWIQCHRGRVVMLLEQMLCIAKDEQIPLHASKEFARGINEIDCILKNEKARDAQEKNAPRPPTLQERAYMAMQRKAICRESGRGYIDAENQEWFRLPEELRMVVLLLARLSGNLQELAGRDWRETPPPERQAIKAAVRAIKRHFGGVNGRGGLVSLASLW